MRLAFQAHTAVLKSPGKTRARWPHISPQELMCPSCLWQQLVPWGMIYFLKQLVWRHSSESISFLPEAGNKRKAKGPGGGVMEQNASWEGDGTVSAPQGSQLLLSGASSIPCYQAVGNKRLARRQRPGVLFPTLLRVIVHCSLISKSMGWTPRAPNRGQVNLDATFFYCLSHWHWHRKPRQSTARWPAWGWGWERALWPLTCNPSLGMLRVKRSLSPHGSYRPCLPKLNLEVTVCGQEVQYLGFLGHRADETFQIILFKA